MSCPSHPPWLDHSNLLGEEYKLIIYIQHL
jgi:hypothetical protein